MGWKRFRGPSWRLLIGWLLAFTLMGNGGRTALGQGQGPLIWTIRNGQIEVNVWNESQGGFTTAYDGVDGRYFSIIDLNRSVPLLLDGFLSVRVDGVDAIYGGDGTTFYLQELSPTLIHEIWRVVFPPPPNTTDLRTVDVDMRITLVHDMVRFQFTVINNDVVPHQVGLRFLRAYNDFIGDPVVPTRGYIREETDLFGAQVPPYWQISSADGTVTLGSTLLPRPGETTPTPPSRLLFADVFRFPPTALWDPDPRVPFENLFLVEALYFPYETVSPGQRNTYVNYFGKQAASVAYGERMVAGIDGPVALRYDPTKPAGEQIVPRPFTISAFIQNLNVLQLENARAVLTLPPGLELVPGETATKVAPSVSPGAEVQLQWEVRGNGSASGRLNYSVAFSADPGAQGTSITRSIEVPALPNQTLPGGLQMVSFPYTFVDPTPAAALGLPQFDFDLIRWNSQKGVYEAVQLLEPGKGYWLRLNKQTEVKLRDATPLSTAVTQFEMRLDRDWNQIGVPYLFPVRWGDIQVVNTDPNDPDFLRPLSVEHASDPTHRWILPSVYRYDLLQQSYVFEQDLSAELQPFVAYWVRALKPNIRLLIPRPIGRAARLPGPATRAASSSDGWRLRIEARGVGTADTYNFIGVSGGANDGYDRKDVEKPPAIQGSVTLGILRNDWGGRAGLYTQDLQSASGGRKQWPLLVTSPAPNTDVTLAWPEIGKLPRSYELYITDSATGQRHRMRQMSSLRVNTGANASRAFTITAEPRSGSIGAFRIINGTVTSRGPNSATISFTATQDASVSIRVLRGTGQPLRTLARRSVTAGDPVKMVWDHRDDKGIAVPAGNYLIEVKGTGQDGQNASLLVPYLVIR
jgi:hypothetical protein